MLKKKFFFLLTPWFFSTRVITDLDLVSMLDAMHNVRHLHSPFEVRGLCSVAV